MFARLADRCVILSPARSVRSEQQSLLGKNITEIPQKGCHSTLFCNIIWEEREVTLTADDLSEQLLWCVSKKRHTAHEELVEDDAHCPPVHRLPVALSQDHLWGNILWGSTYLYRKKYNKYSKHDVVCGNVKINKQESPAYQRTLWHLSLYVPHTG